MLNCFYWYSIIWTAILLLYNLKLSAFNQSLNIGLLVFIIFTIIISFTIGYINRKKFKYTPSAVDLGIMPTIIIVILFVLNFIHAKSIPFFAIIGGSSLYGEFNSIPSLYTFLNAISFYYGINYFNAYLNLNEHKKRNLICFLIINFMFLLVFSRSTIAFLIMGAFVLYILSKKKSSLKEKKINVKKIIIIFFFVFLLLYSFGALGNIRSGYKYNDNSYIQRIGLYEKYPKYLPKQFMWSYSYVTSPLANLNNNIQINGRTGFNYQGFLSELINRTIAIRLFPNIQYGIEAVLGVGIIREYFSASTGYFLMYTYGGFLGMSIQYFVLLMVSYIQVMLLKDKRNEGKMNGTFIVLMLANVLMFFYNSLNTTTVSWWLIINFIALLKKPSINWRSKDD